MSDELPTSGNLPDHEIILIGIERKNYYLFKGDQHINQLLLSDGTFPEPVCCLHFDTLLDVKLILGEAVNVAQYWGIHPDIVERLRQTEKMIEMDG